MEKTVEEEVVAAIDSFVDSANMKLRMEMGKHQVVLKMPFFIQRMWIKSLNNRYGVEARGEGIISLLYKGLVVQPHFEMELVMFHIDYPRFLEPWMIQKVSLKPFITKG